jgi:hypothetical protein
VGSVDEALMEANAEAAVILPEQAKVAGECFFERDESVSETAIAGPLLLFRRANTVRASDWGMIRFLYRTELPARTGRSRTPRHRVDHNRTELIIVKRFYAGQTYPQLLLEHSRNHRRAAARRDGMHYDQRFVRNSVSGELVRS